MSTAEFGTAKMERHDGGTVVVLEADDVIGVSIDLLAELDFKHFDGKADLTLDTAGEYRYRHVGSADKGLIAVFERIKGGDTA
jgi:hypothetical protein